MDLRQSGYCPAVARGSPSLSRLRRLPIYLQASRSLPAAGPLQSTSSRPATRLPTAQLRSEEPARRRRKLGRPPMTLIRVGTGKEPRSDWRRAVAAVSERRVAEGRALYTERSPAELYREARSSERERYARQASRLGAQRPSTRLGRAGDHKVLDLLRSLGIHGERTSAATTLIAAPPTPVLVANLHLHLLLLFLGHLRHLPLLLHSGFSIPGAATSCVRGVL